MRKQLIPGHVTIGVVHILEAVYVDEQDGERVTVSRNVRQRRIEPVEEERAVGDACQRIVVRLLIQPLLAALAIARRVHQRVVIDPEATGEADDERDEGHVHKPAGEITKKLGRYDDRFTTDEQLDRRIAQERDQDRRGGAQIPRDYESRDKHRRACELGPNQRSERRTQDDGASQQRQRYRKTVGRGNF